ncbi:hypothetical protein Tco_1068531 [Tanacetum coccineum]|uniref:Uncharacterized protein n=1 Tax=Tanacetum coccineum TaxID=301880 RepID=A0ABQ5HG41_9ASTR
MAEENVPAPPRTDEQLVPVKARFLIGKSNLLIDLKKMQKNPIFHISVDILQNTNFFSAFTASANVPSIYIQQFKNTLEYDNKTGEYRFQLDEIWFKLNANLLCKALGITPKDFANPFVPPPDVTKQDTQLFKYYRVLSRGQMLTMQVIKTFFTDKANIILPTKKPKPHVIPYCQFTKLIICYLGHKHNIHRRPMSPVHVTGDNFLISNLKFVPKGKKDEVFGMAIPKDLIIEAIQNSEYFDKYVEMAVRKTRKPTSEEVGKKKKA